MEQKIYKKEFSLGELILATWDNYKNNFKLIAALVFTVWLVQYSIQMLFLVLFSGWVEINLGFDREYFTSFLGAATGLADIVATMAIIYATKMKIDGGVEGFGQVLKKSVSRWPAGIWTGIVMFVLLLFLICLFIIPGLIFSVYWMFSNCAVILDGKSGMGALKNSKAAVQGRWFKAFGSYFLIFSFAACLALFILMPVSVAWQIMLKATSLQNDFLIFSGESAINLLAKFILAFGDVALAVFYINFKAVPRSAQKDTAAILPDPQSPGQ